MKKVFFAIIAVLLILALTSCQAQQKCSAYGETSKFQIER